jgi:hypothetical protein
MDNINNDNSLIDYENEKKHLELKKLLLEIEKVENENGKHKVKWFKKSEWYSALLPSLIGFGTILVAFSTGFLNKQSLVNKNENILNKIEAAQFQEQKEKLKKENLQLSNLINTKLRTTDSLESLAKFFKNQKDSFFNIIRTKSEVDAFYLNEIAALKLVIDSKSSEIESLKSPYLYHYKSSLLLPNVDNLNSPFKLNEKSEDNGSSLKTPDFYLPVNSNGLSKYLDSISRRDNEILRPRVQQDN